MYISVAINYLLLSLWLHLHERAVSIDDGVVLKYVDSENVILLSITQFKKIRLLSLIHI